MPKEYYDIVNPIINSKEFQKRKKYQHHGEISVYDHSKKVSEFAYRISKILKINPKNATIAALLHDLYSNDWHLPHPKKKFFQQHGFIHAKEASMNAKIYFDKYLNERILDAIEKHMFPLNIKPPRYIESWIVTISDKLASLDVLLHPIVLLSLLGIRIKKRGKK